MKQYVTSICIFVSSLILLSALCVLSCSAKMTAYLLQKEESTIVSRGIQGLDESKRIIDADFQKKVTEASQEAFDILTERLYDKRVNVKEEEAQELYRREIMSILRSKYEVKDATETGNTPADLMDSAQDDSGSDSQMWNDSDSDSQMQNATDTRTVLARNLDSMLPELKHGDLRISDECSPEFEMSDDRIFFKDIKVDFVNPLSGDKENAFELSAPIKKMTFYDENAEIFTYAMVAGKGIYITGKTSTIMGNIYAGTHAPSELRKAEALYGESGTFGGVNIMSTQLAVDADKIVSGGNINMRGAFVVFGSEEQPVTVYAREVNQTDNVASKNIYALIGTLNDESVAPMQSEVMIATAAFEDINQYYDTVNDVTYTGRYRKIISSTDITVKNDVTGVILTPGNVIIEEGVNVEGLIICGDRIYVQGNNNIVSSVDILREILREELYEEIYQEVPDMTLEEQSLAAVHLYMKDYLGGITRRGID